ncbi:4-hydroxy-3-methylbut-2-enyl diphosphate reductase [Amycolatopsis sp. NPDC006131]|uniref:4-hydroxy-3-methylbut-2-enyl diphosphate reductase n=1 Tax=Amycolatopsis sp. NPDC006131 TaxID=3156731 RepID=UPI0033A897BC
MTVPIRTGKVVPLFAAPGADVLVPHEIRWRDGTEPCPAAPLLAGGLRRRGLRVADGVVLAGSGPPPGIPPGGRAALAPDWAGAPAGPPGPALGVGHLNTGNLRPGHGEAIRAELAAAAQAMRPRVVLLAAPRSFCAGVERAIRTVERALAEHGPPVYVRKQIVHNTHVIDDLAARGAVFVDELDEVPRGQLVIFSAHGVPPSVRAHARERALRVVDATCPLVSKVHAEARRFAGRGDTVVLIGRHDHEEIVGTAGEARESTVVVETAGDVAGLRVPDPSRVSYLTQTTLAVDETAEVVDTLRERFPALRGPRSDDICYAATNRQAAVRAVLDEADLLLVAGSANSANSRHLVELAHRQGKPAHLVDRCEDIRFAWLRTAATVAVTAGASAPPELVDRLVAALGGLGPVTVEERVTAVETVRFGEPAVPS